VRPPWTQPQAGALDVVIDIGLAFGTGSHATTRECLELLQTLEPGSLLDVGTGSGVLAIAAERLGYGPVVGIDNDELAVGAAWDNGMRNGSEAQFEVGDALDPGFRWPSVDVVVANLTLGPLVLLGERMSAMEAAGSRPVMGGGAEAGVTAGLSMPRDVIVAGLLDEQAGEAVAAFAGYREHSRVSAEGWTAVHLRRAGS
jgi:ribosomal protein L11 methyltransferase